MTTTSQFVRAALGISVLAVSAAAQSLFSQGQVLMAEGDPIPGIAGATNGNTSSLDTAVMDLDGVMLFRARFNLVGSTAANDRAYFLGRTRETLQLLVRSGDPEPSGTLGAGVQLISQLTSSQATGLGGSPRISPVGGYIMFGAALAGGTIVTTGTAATGRNDSAIFWGQPGAFQVLAQRGAPTGVGGTLFDTSFSSISYQTTSLNENGLACFQATLAGGDVSGTTNNFATFTGTPGNLSVVMRKGDLIPVTGGTARVGFVGFNAALNRSGWVLHDERFDATGGTAPATTANDSILMVYFPGGTNVIVMREGDQAPGLPAGVLFGSPTISQGFGQTGGHGFVTALSGAGVTTANDNALFLGDLSTQQLVWREGDVNPVVPGALNGLANSSSSYSDFAGGSIAFFGTLVDDGSLTITTSNDQALWVGRPGNLQLIAREGDAAPGFAYRPGFVSATFGPVSAGSAMMNDRGQIVWGSQSVTVVDANGSATLSTCQFAYDPVKGVQLLFESGETIPTVGGPTVANSSGGIQFPSSDGAPLTLNNQGDIVQRVSLSAGGAMIRSHIGSNQCTPSVISGLAGGVQTMQLDAGAAHAFQIYIVLCTETGSRPGFQFGGSQIDLNWDPVWSDFAFNSLNTAPWAGTFGLLDATGKATASFTVPPNIFIYAPQNLRHLLTVVDLNTLQVPFSGEPCGLWLY